MRPSLRGLLLEDADELVADDAPLLLRVGDARQARQEALAGVDHDQVHAQVGLERVAQELRLALAHEAVVDVDAGQAVAHGAVHERRGDGRVDAAGEGADDPSVRARLPGVLVDALADALHGRFDEVGRGPLGRRIGDVQHEVGQHVAAPRRVHDLGVELDAVEVARRVGEAGEGGGVGLGRGAEAGRQAGDGVAVAHPHGLLRAEARQQPIVRRDAHGGRAVLAARRAHDVTTQLDGHQLGAVADAQHGDATAPEGRVRAGCRGVVDGVRPAREDDALDATPLELLERRVEGQQLGVHVQLAHATGDELRELAPEVEDDDAVRGLRRPADRRSVVGGSFRGGRIERDLQVGLHLGVVGGQDAVAGVGGLTVDGLAALLRGRGGGVLRTARDRTRLAARSRADHRPFPSVHRVRQCTPLAC